MSWLVATSVLDDLAALRASPLWRDVRRFNAPVQLAIAAGLEIAAKARSARDAALISLAPCETGSPELHHWVHDIASGKPGVRMNPTHTLHAVDNLALSVLSIRLEARGYGMGLGGAPGMLWVALELARERLERDESEVIIVAGDQETGHRESPASAIALLLAREPAPYAALGRAVRIASIERTRAASPGEPIAHAAAGGQRFLAALAAGRYRVPAADGDGLDDIVVVTEVA
jgi:hypothetical protein